jgi:SulP family sulfate permease
VNHIDLSSQLMLENLQQQLAKRHIVLHLAEIKGFVMDSLVNTPLLKNWQGKIFDTTEQAANSLKPQVPEPEYNL